jgi:hypothetical protein
MPPWLKPPCSVTRVAKQSIDESESAVGCNQTLAVIQPYLHLDFPRLKKLRVDSKVRPRRGTCCADFFYSKVSHSPLKHVGHIILFPATLTTRHAKYPHLQHPASPSMPSGHRILYLHGRQLRTILLPCRPQNQASTSCTNQPLLKMQ